MDRISDALKAIVTENPLLQMGLSHRLFNLSQLSRYIEPQIAARTKKDVQPSAVLMALSRYQRSMSPKKLSGLEGFSLQNLTVTSNLLVTTYTKTTGVLRALHQIHTKLLKKNGFLTISEGQAQVTVIVDQGDAEIVQSAISERPFSSHRNVASVVIPFAEKYLDTPGFLYLILQQLYLQNINIIELTSTATELIVYLDEKDIRLAFDTLYGRFRKRR